MLQLQLETITSCNAACVFCTYPSMKRKRGRMSDAVFLKILKDAAMDLGPFINQVSLQGLGEPLMDKAIAERVYLARQFFPEADISLYTNGSLLTPEMVARLKGAGISQIIVSLTGTNAAEREAAMGLKDFDKVVEYADHARKVLPTKIKLIASRDLIQDMSAQKFLDKWGSDAMVTYEGNWAGEAWKFRGAPQTAPCHRALDQIMFLWDGTLALCCFDGEGHVTFGNVQDKTVKELWEHPERQRIKKLHEEGRRAEVPICKACTSI